MPEEEVVNMNRRLTGGDQSLNAQVSKDGMTVSGDSIMGLLMLAASRGTSIEVTTSGVQAAELSDALAALVANRFGEDF